jgi:hypothetical protein
MLAGTHQRQFDLILNVFDVHCAAAGLTTHQCAHDLVGQLRNQFAHAGRSGALAAIDGEKRFGHRNGNFGRLEGHHGPITAHDLKQRIALVSHVLALRN